MNDVQRLSRAEDDAKLVNTAWQSTLLWCAIVLTGALARFLDRR